MGRHLPADAGSRNLAGSARLDAKGRARLLGLARDLAGALAELRRLRAARPGDPRGDAALLLDLKVVPELARGLDLPLFLGFQGGTNTGKATLFNALAGKLLSPAIPTGSATKHPLVFAHERWRGRLLDAPLFPGFEARQLEDPKRLIVDPERTDLLYVRLHDDARLERLALVDSPDFDGALETNAAGAAAIAAISDVTLFVTTAEKYRDRILVDQLRRLLELKDDVLVVFNRLGEPIVFETLADDLRSVLGPPGAHLRAARLPSSAARHPEDDLRAALVDLTAPLAALDVARTKEATLSRTVRRVAALAAEAAERCSADAELKRELQRIVREGEEECAREY
ncbi:MAG: 50S ribosome-binding GTPase, partial [Planctomycetes bacterium]|nr:50S ribosome-binding GTPase [Planctomycetota bacterium]